ncbi:GlsB/YeaQ/YmgE family stress response membrane protein [Aliiroseovarius sp. F47248L]|uniref:GlsB/YeaQ/YmgE family stress response membrane protein n=1 Tax=Aliiroseovarius sp. F47248L TaxID=2926420 RepID=UPI001FF65035|nr:GlsB/YeaQ/YmgE family stress response membrane protein [Aliiroseovarius sp. F47248L]MCK0140434.1 GlsB/YeaQ/YmgE family stress response membrane protein [Aliiroseovarius sp. F47248L]
MPVILLIIFGAAAGFLATRIMDLRTDVPTTIAIGVAGALIGGFVLRSIAMIGGLAFGFVGAVVGSILLIWIWQKYKGRR